MRRLAFLQGARKTRRSSTSNEVSDELARLRRLRSRWRGLRHIVAVARVSITLLEPRHNAALQRYLDRRLPHRRTRGSRLPLGAWAGGPNLGQIRFRTRKVPRLTPPRTFDDLLPADPACKSVALPMVIVVLAHTNRFARGGRSSRGSSDERALRTVAGPG